MAKKLGKFVMTTAALGALAAGAYYLFTKKDSLLEEDFDEDDDYDDFDEDLDEDGEAPEGDRKYVDLDLTKASQKVEEAVGEKAGEFKEGLEAAKAEAADKIVGAAKEAADAVNEAETKVEEFFDDEDEAGGEADEN